MAEEKTTPVEVEYPSDQVLKDRYADIETTAREIIEKGQLIGNPLLRETFRGDRWSISTHGYVKGSPAGDFLEHAENVLKIAEPGLDFIPPELLHLSFTEVAFDAKSRKAGGFSGADVIAYHDAILAGFPQSLGPLQLELYKIIPTLDPKQEGMEGQTGAVVAAFLTGGDNKVFKIREGIISGVKQAGLATGSNYGGPPRVLFITLGRFAQAPARTDRNSCLNAIDKLNGEITPGMKTHIDRISIIETTPLDYKAPRGHIEIWPPLALKAEDQIQGDVKLLRPRQRGK